MSRQAIETTDSPPAKRERSANGKVTGRLKRAIDAMIWRGISDNQAAVENRITISALRIALGRPHVRAYLIAQRQVFRTSELGANIHTLIAVRDGGNQMARIQAVRTLEQMDDETTNRTHIVAPGLVIVLANTSLTPSERTIEHKPLITQGPVSDDA